MSVDREVGDFPSTSKFGLDRRGFMQFGCASIGAAAILRPATASATPAAAPVSGIYCLLPPDSFFGSLISKATFYNTGGLDGVVLNPGWSDIETSQGVFDFVDPIKSPLRSMFAANPNMKFALGIGAGWQSPAYLLSPISYNGSSSYQIANLILTNNGAYQAFAFPFDPGYVSCYLNMLNNVLYFLSTTPIVNGSSTMMISRMTSLKLSLYTGGDLEITIPSWLPGTTNPSEAQLWHDAFITPGCRQSGVAPFNTSNWPTYSAAQWQTVVENAWSGFVSSVATMINTTYGLTNITFSCPMYSPGDSFPKIDSSGNVMNALADNSSFAFGLMTSAAAAVSNPVVLMYQALGLDISSNPATLVYNSDFETYFNSGSYPTYVAFQTNGWDNGSSPTGGSKAATGSNSGNDVVIDAGTTSGCDHFVTLVSQGALVPQGTSVYSPYIELHYSDIAKWGYSSSSFPNARGKNMIQSIHTDIFGS